MSMFYKKLADTLPIRDDDIAVAGATFATLGGFNDDTNSDSYKYGQYAETKTDYYYGKDDNNLKAVVAKITITATDEYKAAKKIDYIQRVKTFAVGGTDTVTYDGATYTWTATGTAAAAGAWTDADDNPVTFTFELMEEVLDARIAVNGTSYTKNFLWVKNIVDNVAANASVPTTQTTGVGTLDSMVATLAGSKLKSKTNATACANEGDKGYFYVVLADANGDHEGKEVRVDYTVFVSATGEYNCVLAKNEATDDYELAQALDAMEAGDKINLTTLAIS